RVRAGTPGLSKEFGRRVGDFIEPGMVFLGPDLKVIHRIDRMTTFNEEWLYRLLGNVLHMSPGALGETQVERHPGVQAILDGKPDPDLFIGATGDDARWYQGVAYWQNG